MLVIKAFVIIKMVCVSMALKYNSRVFFLSCFVSLSIVSISLYIVHFQTIENIIDGHSYCQLILFMQLKVVQYNLIWWRHIRSTCNEKKSHKIFTDSSRYTLRENQEIYPVGKNKPISWFMPMQNVS